jgi:hypothetical protein
MKKIIKEILKEELESQEEKLSTDPSKGIVAPSQKVISDVCEKEKFCKKQGPITFGQLRKIVETAQTKNLAYDIGEGFYKALIRLIPWFFPQLAIAGFVGSSIRAFNKIIRPGLEDTRGYKSWWGKTIMSIMDMVEGDIPHSDPISKIFFISDGLLHMLDRKFKLKFARYIAELASSKPDSEPVPEYFVENELRKWINQKFLLNPPLSPKTINESEEDDSLNWIRDVEIKTDLTPAQIYFKYDVFPVEVVGPYIAGQFRDIEYRNGKLYFITDGWCDLVNLFEDTDGGYNYVNRYLAEKILCDEDWWEPYSSSDLIGREWKSNVWSLVTENEEAIKIVLNHIKKYYVVPNNYNPKQLDIFGELPKEKQIYVIDGRILDDDFFEDLSQDLDSLGDIIDDEMDFEELKRELGWAYASSYNTAVTDNIYNSVKDSIIDFFGNYKWEGDSLVFEATDLILNLIKNRISDCWDDHKNYYNPERHKEEGQTDEEAFESFAEECIDKPFDEYSWFIDFLVYELNGNNDELNPRYDEYPSNSELKKYFVDDLQGRI